MTVIDTTDASFEKDVIEQSNKIPIVVDFWAPWCMPCRMLSPVLDKVVEKYNGKFVLVKVNVDDYHEAASKHGVLSIPSVKLFKKGKIVDEFVGASPEPFIKQWLENNDIKP